MSAPDLSAGEKPNDVVEFVVIQDGRERMYVAEKRKLAAVSNIFRDMFEKNSPTNANLVTIRDLSPRAFKVMLRHVYGKPYCLDDWELSLEVYHVAEKFRIFSLQEECEELFSRTPICSSNALDVYKLASKYDVQKVLSLCEESFEKDVDIFLTPGFKHAEKDIVKKIMRHGTQLQTMQVLALINWGRVECVRRGIPVNAKNVESCVIGVCGTRLAIDVSKAIEKLKSAEKKSDTGGVAVTKSPLSHTALVCLGDSGSGTIKDSFNMDIICEVKICVFDCVLEFTGIELHLKKSNVSEESSLEIFYSTENVSEGISIWDTKVDGTIDERKEIAFAQGLTIKSGQFANITVRIEDLQMSQCLQNFEVQREVVDKTKGIHFKLEFRSNQVSATHQGPFFIEKLFYKSLS